MSSVSVDIYSRISVVEERRERATVADAQIEKYKSGSRRGTKSAGLGNLLRAICNTNESSGGIKGSLMKRDEGKCSPTSSYDKNDQHLRKRKEI